MLGQRAGSTVSVYAQVQCPEPKTGQQKVQLYCEDIDDLGIVYLCSCPTHIFSVITGNPNRVGVHLPVLYLSTVPQIDIIPLKPSFTWPLSIIYNTQFQTKNLMKALVFLKFRNIFIKTILWTMNTYCFPIFVHT